MNGGRIWHLKKDKGHLLVLAALDTLDKEAVLKKQEKFDDFFKRSWRRTGQDMADYIREKETKSKRFPFDLPLPPPFLPSFLLSCGVP